MMKKSPILAILLVLVVAMFISCSSQDAQDELQAKTTDEKEMVQLIENLNNYNAAFAKEHAEIFIHGSSVTRAWGFRKWLHVVFADARGAMRGAQYGGWGSLAGAAIYSLLAAFDEDIVSPERMIEEELIADGPLGGGDNGSDYEFPDKVDAPLPLSVFVAGTVLDNDLAMCADSVGYYHNALLYDLCIAPADSVTDTLAVVNRLCASAELMSDGGRGNTTNAQLLAALNYTQYKALYPTLTEITSFNTFVQNFESMFSDNADEISFLKSYVETLCEIDPEENDGSYAEGVLSVISQSALSDTAKKRLGDAVITGNASAKLWA